MDLNLHANATTTPKTRAYIQRSKKSAAQLAAELGVSETTIYRWRDRTTVEDRSHRPKNLVTSLSAVEERAVCELRTSLQLPLDDIVEVIQRCINALSSHRHCFTTMPSASSPPVQTGSDVLMMINRRRVLGALAGTSLLPSRAFADVVYQRSEIREDLAKHFVDAGTAGTFVGYKTDDYLVIASDKTRSGEAKLPASTYKIPNSLIALETGVVGDPDKDVFKWDGVVRSIEAWNKDHTMRSAIAASVVPVYQEIARRIGQERMQKYVDLFEYGNRDIGGGIDQFWLTGNLRIDPVQQVDFVDRLRRGVLPVSKRSQDLVRDILPVTTVGDTIIRTKSGLLGAEIGKPSLGWMVGWAEKGSAQTVFALNLDVRDPSHIADRMKLTQQCLTDIGAI
jgi:beta-lactamase class D